MEDYAEWSLVVFTEPGGSWRKNDPPERKKSIKRIGIHPTESGSAWFQHVSNVFQFPSLG